MRHVKTVTGIRKKILYGFVILGSLLFFSGMISFFELAKLSRSTRTIMDGSIQDVELSKRMLDAVQEQNTALLQIVSHADSAGRADTLLMEGRRSFEEAFRDALRIHENTGKLTGVSLAKDNYDQIVNQIYADTVDIANIGWFTNVYKTSYYDLTLANKNFMIDTQYAIDRNTDRIRENAYRALMPGIITLGVAIILIIVFFALIDLYYIKPVLKITQGLRNYLVSKIPFNVRVEGHDEIAELRDLVEEMVDAARRKEQQ